MTEEKQTHQVYALEAIEAVSRRGLRRYRVILAGILAVIIVSLAVFWYLPAKQATWPVAVFYPKLEGPVGENAKRQQKGFHQAFVDNQVDILDRRLHEYVFPPEEEEQKRIIDEFEKLYTDGVRTFIMTMSGGVKAIKTKFIIWAKGKRENDRPVLVATVASAPGIAMKEEGVFRYYVRSEEESSVLSTYIESKDAKKVYVFYVDDDYGRAASKDLDDRLKKRKKGQSTVTLTPVDLKDKREQIDTHIVNSEILSNSSDDDKVIAVIIGYGPMIADTLLGLKDREESCEELCEKPKLDMLVVSTFTEREWRPNFQTQDKKFFDRIHSVGLGELDPQRLNRGVVFQFSYLTLDRALKCNKKHGVEAFWACWIKEDLEPPNIGKDWAQIEFTSKGDSLVSLRILNSDEWRDNR